jgi:hypothetical protein
MAFDRTQVIQGPAIITFNAYTYYTEGDITVETQRETWEPKTSIYGALTKRAASTPVTKIKFTPVGVAAAATNYINAFTPANIGQLLFGATDKPVVIQTVAGKQITWAAGAITKTPDLILSSLKMLWGEMEISTIGKKSTALTDPAFMAAIITQAFSDTSFDSSKVPSAPYQAALGTSPASPFDAIVTQDGFTVSNNMTVNPLKIANYGTVNWVIAEVIASVKFIPANCDDQDLWNLFQLQGSNAIAPGGDVASLNQNLVITGGVTPNSVNCTISNVGPDKTASRYGLAVLRAGEVELFSRKSFVSGVLQSQIALTFS